MGGEEHCGRQAGRPQTGETFLVYLQAKFTSKNAQLSSNSETFATTSVQI